MTHTSTSWRDCVIWLKAIGFLPERHRILKSDTLLSDFVDLLQDGSVLCYVLHYIDPSSIDIKRVHNHSCGSEMSSIHNARLFLNACNSEYGITPSYLFDEYDLFNRERFDRVLLTLSQLSQSARYSRSRLVNDLPPHTFIIACDESTDIYEVIKDKPSELVVEDEETIYGHYEDDIYAALIYSRIKDDGDSQLESPDEERSVKLDKRAMVINEILETEREYVRVLDALINHYHQYLRPYISPEKLFKIFCNNSIATLLEYHKGLLVDLQKAVDMDVPIAGALVTWQPKLANYAHYFSALDEAMVTLEQCQRDPTVQGTLDQLKSTASIQQCRFNLCDVLKVPGQRILRYHILIDALLKSLPPGDSRERTITETAAEKVKDLNAYMNESKRDAELKKKLLALRETIQDSDLSNDVEVYGKLLKDGELKVKFDLDGTMRKCHVFLFQRGLLFSNNRMDILSVTRSSSESRQRALFTDYDVDENYTKSNSILIKHKSLNKHIVLSCKSAVFHSEWLQQIKNASSSSDPEKLSYNRHRFVLTTFPEVSKCFACDLLLKGNFCQGYRCENCRYLSHHECFSRVAICSYSIRKSSSGSLGSASSGSSSRPVQVVHPMQGTPVARASSFIKASLPLRESGHLSVAPGDLLEVFNDDVDSSFGLRARKVQTGELGYLPHEYLNMNKNGCDVKPHRTSVVNDEPLRDYPWFSHVRSREISSKNCLMCPNLTFLVRKSETAMTYALMVHFNNIVRNIRIELNREQRWYIAPELSFPTIPDLIDFYTRNSLQTNFPQLPTTLRIPFYEGIQMLKIQLKPLGYVGLGQMMYAHKPESNREMELGSGELVKILSNIGGKDSLWRVEALMKCEIPNRDPDYLPVKGLVPGSKVKVF